METIVRFYNTVDDSLLKFAVIVAKSNGKWVFCKHKERSNTYECPGGHREAGEAIDDTAKRELYEETGAIENGLDSIGVLFGYGTYDELKNAGATFIADTTTDIVKYV